MSYLQTTYELCFREAYFESCDFSSENANIETYRWIHVYLWFKDDNHVIWMWIWLILKNISLLDRIWSSYSCSAGWYFRYQSIQIHITHDISPPLIEHKAMTYTDGNYVPGFGHAHKWGVKNGIATPWWILSTNTVINKR